MRGVIEDDYEHAIGGDEQRVSDMDVTYSHALFKARPDAAVDRHLPLRRQDLAVMVNANTGEVVGDRPWSVPKIVAAVLAALVVIGIVVALVMAGSGGEPSSLSGARPVPTAGAGFVVGGVIR